MIYIASDHRGFELKNRLVELLSQAGYDISDAGPSEHNPSDDYPEYVAKAITGLAEDFKNNKAILLCGSGVGVCVAANKYRGVRAALAWQEEIARAARNDEDANVLCLPAEHLEENVAFAIAKMFLETSFSGAERHIRRLKEISEINNG
jgi:ribose 5-phosphate isomerase B